MVLLQHGRTLPDAAARRQELEKAEQTFLAVRGLTGKTDEYRMNLAQVYYWLGKHREGRQLFDEVLADKFERALPGRVSVQRRSARLFSKEKRVVRIELALGDNRFIAVAEGGGLETRWARAVRGVVLKSEVLPLDSWLEALARELSVEAEASEQSRLALEQLLGS